MLGPDQLELLFLRSFFTLVGVLHFAAWVVKSSLKSLIEINDTYQKFLVHLSRGKPPARKN